MFTVHYADRIPVFADVLERDATIDPLAAEKVLRADPDIGAVLAVHLYGHPAAMEELADICSKHGVLLIEDFAPALGGVYENGTLFGTFGDLSVVSFGYAKILDVGGGGAILTDDAEIASRARVMAEQLPSRSEDADLIQPLYRKLYYAVWECGQVDSRFYRMYDFFPDLFRALYIFRVTDEIADRIHKALRTLDDELVHRRKLASLYAEGLGDRQGVYVSG